MTRPSRLARLAIASALAAAGPITCNVFASIERCESDSDCPALSRCDLQGRYCVAPPDADTSPETAPPDAQSDADAGVDAAPPCDRSLPFADLALVEGLGDRSVYSARFLPNESLVLLAIGDVGGETDLSFATRDGGGGPFGPSTPIAGVNAPATSEYWPTMSADGKLLFFESNRSLQKVDGGYVREHARIWTATRVNLVSEFEEPRIQSIFAFGPGSQEEASPYLHPSGRALYFSSFQRPGKGSGDIFVADLDPENGLAASVTNIAAVNTDLEEIAPVVSLDDTTLYFARQDAVTLIRDVFVSTRAGTGAPFGAPLPVTELNTPYEEFPSWISEDRCRLYFFSDRPAPGAGLDAGADADAAPEPSRFRLWVASRR